MSLLETITDNLVQGEIYKVRELTQKALSEGISPDIILSKGFFAGMEMVGKLFKDEEIFVPEVMMAAHAMQAGTEVLEPSLAKVGGGKKLGKVILGTVKGDVHNLGKKLVDIMLRGSGFDVTDLGECVPPEKFVDAALSEKAQIVGISALLTTTMPYMRTTIESLEKAGLKGRVKTLIGGACVTQEYADEIGADGYSKDAGVAVDKAKELLGLK